MRELAATPAGAPITCAGHSMEPTIARGQELRVFACDTIAAGDVVLFENARGDGYVLHRVICRLPGTPYLVHIGDAGRRGDPGITTRQRIIGRAPFARRGPSARLLLGAGIAIAQAARRRLAHRRR